MTDFQKLITHLRRLEALAHPVFDQDEKRRRITTLIAQSEIRVNPYHEALFQSFKPSFYVSAGERTARLDKVQLYDNGKTVAFYSIVCRNPRTGLQERYAWRYGIRNGVIQMEKAYPVTAR